MASLNTSDDEDDSEFIQDVSQMEPFGFDENIQIIEVTCGDHEEIEDTPIMEAVEYVDDTSGFALDLPLYNQSIGIVDTGKVYLRLDWCYTHCKYQN